MFHRRSTAYSRICRILALGLILRSLVAPGLMLVDGTDGIGSLALVLCPAQNRSLNFDLLAGSAPHHHHYDAGEDTAGSPLDGREKAGVHADSLDAGCALWAGSTSGIALAARGPSIVVKRSTEVSISFFYALTATSTAILFQPRAPPIVT